LIGLLFKAFLKELEDSMRADVLEGVLVTFQEFDFPELYFHLIDLAVEFGILLDEVEDLLVLRFYLFLDGLFSFIEEVLVIDKAL
jgi:hypothetical protein